MRVLWAAAFILRRLRTEAGVMLLVFVLVGATAALLGAAPRLFAQAADEGLLHDVEAARPLDRNLQISVVAPAIGSSPANQLGVQSGRFRTSMPQDVQALISESTVQVTSTRFVVTDAPERRYVNTFVRLQYRDGIDDAIRLVAGRMPQALGQPLPPPTFGFIAEQEYVPPEEVPRFEIAISDQTSEESNLKLGDVIGVSVDGSDPLLPRAFGVPLPAELEVVGIFTVTQPDAEVWFGDRTLQAIEVWGTVDNPLAFVTALVADRTYNDLAASGLPFTQTWRYLIDPSRIDSGKVETLSADMQRFQSQFITSATVSRVRAQPILRTGLPELLNGYVAERSASEAALSVAAIGPLFLAAAAVGMVGILIVSRRRAAIALSRGRGASTAILMLAQLWEALLIVGVALIAGMGAVWLVAPGRESPLSVPLALAVAAGAVVALVAAGWPAARRSLLTSHEEDRPVGGPSPRRLVLEGTAVLIALGGVVLLRQRGLTMEAGRVTTFDPLLAATPALAGLAVGIVSMRLYPVPVRALGWLAAARRDLVPVLGLRSVARHPAVANLPLLVLMLTAAFGAFASVVNSTIDRGQQVASWQNLGADYRIERIGGGPVDRLDPMQVPGVQAVAGAYVDRQARFSSTAQQSSSISFYAIDAAAYDQVTAGSPVASTLATTLRVEEGTTPLGTIESPIPAILSRRLPPASENVGVGNTFTVTVAGQRMTFKDVRDLPDFPGIPSGTTFVVAPLNVVQAAYVNQTLAPNQLMVKGGPDAEAGLRAMVRQDLALGLITSRHAEYQELRQAPLVSAVATGFQGALVVAAIYTALTVMAALTLSAAARTRDLAFLRTLGFSARQSTWLTVMKHAPPALIALIPGVLLGIAVAILLTPSLGLSAFAGTDRDLSMAIDWSSIATMSGALLAVVAAAIGLSTWTARRARAADALRIGDD